MLIEKTKSALSKSRLKIALVTLAIAALLFSVSTGGTRTIAPTNDVAMSHTSVKITNLARNSGGTGVILKSESSESTILTNAHVCEVATKTGIVLTSSGASHAVTSYKRSEDHDLCLVTVAADLGVNTTIAARAPSPHSAAAVSGHPRLLPNVVTKGHFSGREIIQVMTGFRPCTKRDLQGNNIILCMFLGGIPVIRTYEAQLVTATIMPGNSGSAVFNESGEISGLVFAGSGSLGYAYIVPFESVANFVDRESKALQAQRPASQFELSFDAEGEGKRKRKRGIDTADQKTYRAAVRSTCSTLASIKSSNDLSDADYDRLKKVCIAAERDMLWIE